MSSDIPGLCGSCAMFLRALAILALPAEHQIDWLQSLGLGDPDVCDELADEYYQQWLLLPQFLAAGLIPRRAEDGLNRLNDVLGELIRPGSAAASVESLRSSSEWQTARDMAARCLLLLK